MPEETRCEVIAEAETIEVANLVVRASASDRVEDCPASATAPTIRIEENRDDARMGSAVHSFLAEYILTHERPDVAAIANEFDVNRDDLDKLCRIAWAYWNEVRQYFHAPKTEIQLAPYEEFGVTATGTVDVISPTVDERTVYILDFKSGYGDNEHPNQLRTYGWLALNDPRFSKADRVIAIVLRLRQGQKETFKWDRGELQTWWESFAGNLLARQDVYRPGHACTFCPLRFTCVARTTHLQSHLAALPQTAVMDVKTLTADQAIAAKKTIGILEKFLESAKAALKTHVATLPGERMVGTDGQELVISHGEKRKISYAIGEDTLRAHLGDEVYGCVTVGNGKMEKAVSNATPRGSKSKAIAALWAELEEAGAVTTDVSEGGRLEIRKTPLAIATAPTHELATIPSEVLS